MERRSELARKTPLVTDPEKTRAWQQRSRAELRRTELRGGSARVAADASWRDLDPEELFREALRVPFKARRPARTQRCFRCRRRAQHWHHWVRQEYLRVMLRGFARETGLWLEPREVKRTLRFWLRDERNLSPVCGSCHGAGTHAEAFAASEVPESARVFAVWLDASLMAAGRPVEAVAHLEASYR